MKKIIKYVFAILNRREKTVLVKLIVFDVIVSILDISFLVMLLFIVRYYTEAHHSVNMGIFSSTIFSRFPLLPIGVFFILFSLKNLAGYSLLRMQFRFVYGVSSRLSRKNLLHYLEGSYQDYVNIDSSVHNRRINQQPIEFGHYVLNGFQQIFSQSVLILITIVATLIFNPVLFLLLFLLLTPPIVLTGFLIKRKMSALRKVARPLSEKTLQSLQEALSGFIESNVYERNGFFTKRYDAYQTRFNDFMANQQVIQNLPSKLIEVFAVFGFFILILLNSYTGNTNTVQLITIGAFMGAAYKIIPGIVKILNSVGQIRTYGFTAADLAKEHAYSKEHGSSKMHASTEEQGSPKEHISQEQDTLSQETKGIRSIAFSGVSFHYTGEPVLEEFYMSIARGEIVGLSGTSGRGKTTVINLLLGFLDPLSGTISVNGVSTSAIDRQQYWRYISYVKQQPFMIADSMLRNIVLDEHAADPRRLKEAIKIAGLDVAAGIFPEGLDKQLTENGKNISGGQRQRVAFARALYKEADLVILDEPFNELDEPSEKEMLQYCKKLAQSGKAILLISHNKDCLSFCNKIISLNE